MSDQDRKCYAAFETSVETQTTDDKEFRIRGVANTFRVMNSGTMIHPSALDEYFAANPQPKLKLMINHGAKKGGDLKSIGVVDELKVTERGLEFSAFIINGTTAANEARELIKHGVVDRVSLGWMVPKSAIKHVAGFSTDPIVAARFRESGRSKIEVHYKIRPVEVSLVDSPDDPDAHVSHAAALREAMQDDEFVTALAKRISDHELVATVPAEQLREAIDNVFETRLKERFTAFLNSFGKEALELMITVAADPRGDYAQAILDATDDAIEDGCGVHHRTAGADDDPPSSDESLHAALGRLRETVDKL